MTIRRMILCGLLSMIAVAMMSSLAPAFCPMCKTVVEGATGAQEMAGSLNFAALVLMAPPVILFAALFGLFYRLRNAGSQPSAPAEKLEERAPAARFD